MRATALTPPGRKSIRVRSMPRVHDKRYYRIQHEGAYWTTNESLSFGNELNQFTANLLRESTTVSLGGKDVPVNIALASIYNAVIGPTYANKRLSELPALPGALHRTLKGFHDALLAVRELSFENVRLSKDSSLPSRRTCIFLIPDRAECVKFWWHKLKSQGATERRLYEVCATGASYIVSQSYLGELESCSVKEWERRANIYWSAQSPREDDEVLFEGDVRVVRQADIGEFGLSDDV